MFRHILVGVDGGSRGRDAITLARGLAEADSALTLGHVFTAYHDIYADQYAELEQESAMRLLRRTREQTGVEARITCIEARSVGRGLHRLAEREHCDLVVVGSSRRGHIGRVLLGDDTRSALSGAPCAMAVAPAGLHGRRWSPRRIGVGEDGSAESRYALRVARSLASETGARLSAYRAVMVPTTPFGPGRLPVSDRVDPLISDAIEELTAEGIEAHAGYGPAGERLAEYSSELDLLVIGSRNEGAVGRLLHGSTSQQLTSRAACPLLVLPHSGTAITVNTGESGLAAAGSRARRR